jgi:FixJ family two-component response regulator
MSLRQNRVVTVRRFIATAPSTDQPSAFVVAVLDDDQSGLRWLGYLLESKNYAVRLFTSGTALLDSGRLAEIACLISDIDMRGMDGIELLGRIHALHPGLPTILITGYPDRLERLPPLGSIYPGLFTKPFQAEELLAAVRDISLLHTRTP